jgi:hypothetical protein
MRLTVYLLCDTKSYAVLQRAEERARTLRRKPIWPHPMIDRLQRGIAWLMNHIRVNQIQERVQDGATVFIKRRRVGGSLVAWFGNRFLALARSGIWMFVRAGEWVDWEIYCVQLLYPERPRVKAGHGPSVIVPKACGVSLRQLLRRNEAIANAFAAAARELRRVHQIPCSYYDAAWSHGDLHLDNIIYDAATCRAVLIDFDTRHDDRLSALQRHGDDLKVMLLELMELPDEQWHESATTLIEEYRDAAVLGELVRQLFVPRGFARILWYVRTNGAATRQVERRLEAMRTIIERVTADARSDLDRRSIATQTKRSVSQITSGFDSGR